MRIRLGFVAMSMTLKNASPSRTMTYKTYQSIPDDESRIHRLKKLTRENLTNTLRIMRHAEASDIKMYRITSKLVPLATHEQVIDWNYIWEMEKEFQLIKDFIQKHDMRISAHPDHFTLLTSNRKEVIEASIRDLVYHDAVLTGMGLEPERGKLVLHVGGTYKNKSKAIDTFISNFTALPKNLKKRIILENDDKSYTASETLSLCQMLQIPMVFDVHHHLCNPDGLSLEDLLCPIFDTWKGQKLIPKVHFSSPKSPSQLRNHADYIDSSSFYEFLMEAKKLDRDFDVMLEAKSKDKALFQLVEDLRQYKNIHFLNEACFEYS